MADSFKKWGEEFAEAMTAAGLVKTGEAGSLRAGQIFGGYSIWRVDRRTHRWRGRRFVVSKLPAMRVTITYGSDQK